MSLNIRAEGLELTTFGLDAILGVGIYGGDGVRDVLGVEPPRGEDLTESDEGVRGSAENRFRLLNVALNGLVLLVGERKSSVPGPLLVLGGGRGGNVGERTDGERDKLLVSGRR